MLVTSAFLSLTGEGVFVDGDKEKVSQNLFCEQAKQTTKVSCF